MAEDDFPLIEGRWGYIVYTEHFRQPFGPDTVIIERADPWALVTDEILMKALCRDPRPLSAVLTLRPPATDSDWCNAGEAVCGYLSHRVCFTGWTMTINAETPIVYRIGKFRPVDNCWEASWPD